MYKALVTVADRDGTPFGAGRLRSEAEQIVSAMWMSAGAVRHGTSHGEADIWVEARTDSAFRLALKAGAEAAARHAFHLTAVCGQESFAALDGIEEWCRANEVNGLSRRLAE